MLKLSLFVIVAGLSYVLMLSNHYFYRHPTLDQRISSRAHDEIMHLKKVEQQMLKKMQHRNQHHHAEHPHDESVHKRHKRHKNTHHHKKDDS